VTAAAFFDLDRTLIATSSAPVFQRCLVEAGLAPAAASGVTGAFTRAFDVVGESYLVMQLARLAPRSATGMSVSGAAAACTSAAAELAAAVHPFALLLIDEHRAAGRPVVLATSSPDHMVRPLAELLGFDDVIATRWAHDGEVYSGAMDGPFVWGRGKRDAVATWAAEHGVSLRESHAYSDSYFDAPLLDAVGHPVAVNPDVRLGALALIKGWPIRHLDAPPGVVKVGGYEIQELIRPFADERLIPGVRVEISGLEHIPERGGAILVGNHRSYFDSTVIALVVAKARRNARFLGKKEVFDAPIVGALARAAGGIRVERASGSDEPLEHAAEMLRAGELVALMPQGTIPRGPAFFETELKGRWGAARLAAMSGVPVIPVGLWGTEKVWPRSSRLPHLDLVDPPLVTATVGPPVDLKYRSADKDTRRIMAAIVDLLPPEARERREPTDEELARTFPPGYTGDPRAEADRRPGTDA
jgi:putative phosphoserine phosphatase / 1-acylglycerol-3-phosphate O-acyltransferase